MLVGYAILTPLGGSEVGDDVNGYFVGLVLGALVGLDVVG